MSALLKLLKEYLFVYSHVFAALNVIPAIFFKKAVTITYAPNKKKTGDRFPRPIP
jgi:hypothetical protein